MSKGIRNAILKIFKLRNSEKKTFALVLVYKSKRSHRVDYSAMVKGHKAKKY